MKKNNTHLKFSYIELIAISKVLKHSQQFGQSVAPTDIIDDVIRKINDSTRTRS